MYQFLRLEMSQELDILGKGMRNMPKKTFTAEQIISKLSEAEVLISHIVPMSIGSGKPSLRSARPSG